MPLGSSAGVAVITGLPCAWAAQDNAWLVIKLTPKDAVFSFLFFLFLLAL